ncbi:protein FAM83F-like [Hemiscyllium ocellatum]|uniref:protein FAM83F-like n=1 Tax=Hemiscyllium ocellatum TaxID=170820 RepID=UPI002966006A|nr:protein FAM83F-like [Hemiscyllium ocellatum]
MGSSQLECLADSHINVRITDKNPEFYYCENQRLALDVLLKSGEVNFHKLLEKEGIKEFISSKETEHIRRSYHRYEAEGKDSTKDRSAVSDSKSTYWPEQSDTPIPDLDLGWSEPVTYRGVTRVNIHMHPPRNHDPNIKEIVRKMIQEARKVIAVAMDEFTDRNIFKDLIEASSRRRVPVYIILEQDNVKYFLEMCKKMELNNLMIRYLRVRSIAGTGLYLASGYVPGSLSQRFMIVDGDKVLSGSYSFTWSSSRLNRSTVAIYTGQILENFDMEFRQLYANSDLVDLHELLDIKAAFTGVTPSLSASPIPLRSDDLKRKFHNPKYLLVTEGVHRVPSEHQLPPADEVTVRERSVRFRERRGTMRDSKKQDHSKSVQVVEDWLLKNDVRGLEEPEPLEDLVPPSKMPNASHQTSTRFSFSNWVRNSSRRLKGAESDSQPVSESRASRRNLKLKFKKDSGKSGKVLTETENPTDLGAGKASPSMSERGRNKDTPKSKEQCVLS